MKVIGDYFSSMEIKETDRPVRVSFLKINTRTVLKTPEHTNADVETIQPQIPSFF
jgi:hypothetical protein